jgi:hypothetical protein
VAIILAGALPCVPGVGEAHDDDGHGPPALRAQIERLTVRIASLEATLACVSRSGTDLIIDGCNVHVRNGTGATIGRQNGLGNVIIGYNERGSAPPQRSGSHNLVVGPGHSYASVGGLVAGRDNTLAGPHATVAGGMHNRATAPASAVSGGMHNRATGEASYVAGGGGEAPELGNVAVGKLSAVKGGVGNVARGPAAAVLGGKATSPRPKPRSSSGEKQPGDGSGVQRCRRRAQRRAVPALRGDRRQAQHRQR